MLFLNIFYLFIYLINFILAVPGLSCDVCNIFIAGTWDL